ncbi:hypothetical protein B0H16DRAFT_1879551 [Mycena metata]|uniref:F-box domain-containing protein n=1 Tax=Mycena metata TaxID=1033252 RepID=A0AAD7K154_9AGAR|nr:hypothetical protein B0H16DRAFT_1879551 [Mycena metata]
MRVDEALARPHLPMLCSAANHPMRSRTVFNWIHGADLQAEEGLTGFPHTRLFLNRSIMEHCSPLDLVNISRTSRFLRSFIHTHSHLWSIAQTNMARGDDCPGVPVLPVVEASGNYTHSAYACFLFEGGSCSLCSEWTEEPPIDFAFRTRICSSKKCKKRKAELVWVDNDRKYENFHWGKWLPRRVVGDPGLPNGETTYSYSFPAIENAESEREYAVSLDAGFGNFEEDSNFVRRTVEELNEECDRRERSRPALLENASKLEAWHLLYNAEHERVLHQNLEILRSYAVVEKRKFQGIMRCPTISAIFHAFNRDLNLITHTVWIHNRDRVLAELKAMTNGALPPGAITQHNDKIRCTHCSRLLRGSSMKDHLVDKHSDLVSKDPVAQRDKQNLCSECPGSKRLYTQRGLKDHRRSKHA